MSSIACAGCRALRNKLPVALASVFLRHSARFMACIFGCWTAGGLFRANVLASLLGTFFGNPLTYIPIGAAALGTGYAMLSLRMDSELHIGFGQMFIRALSELWYNFRAMFTVAQADWTYLIEFWHTIFFPWLVGGVPPGIISGLWPIIFPCQQFVCTKIAEKACWPRNWQSCAKRFAQTR